jgi:hypothetical protein
MTLAEAIDWVREKMHRESKERMPRVIPVVRVLTGRVFTIDGVGVSLTAVEAYQIGEALDRAGLLGAPSPSIDPDDVC